MPIINVRPALDSLFLMGSTAYRSGFQLVTPQWRQVAMEISSTSEANLYSWLGVTPQMREWVGDRHIQSLRAHSYTLVNKKFESTVEVDRDQVEDEMTGMLRPVFERMGESAALHPDEVLFSLINNARVELCYDGLPMFSASHPVAAAAGGVQSNLDSGGGGPYWYLAQLNSAIKPFIMQMRRPYDFRAFTDTRDADVFWKDKYIYGVDARLNAGFGLWQMAYASNQTLNATNFEAAFTAMENFTTDNGQPLASKPTHLIVPTTLRFTAEKLILDNFRVDAGVGAAQDNILKNRVDIIVSPFLDKT